MGTNMAAFASFVGSSDGPIEPEAACMIGITMMFLDIIMATPFGIADAECGNDIMTVDGMGCIGLDVCRLPSGHEGMCGSGDPPN